MNRPRTDERCEYEHLAAGAALYALEPEEDAEFSAHVPNCARCQEVLRSSREAASSLGTGVPQEEPPPELRERILAEAARTPQVHGGRLAEQDRPSRTGELERSAEPRRVDARRYRTRVLVAAAAVVAIAVTGVLGARVIQLSNEQQQTVAQSEQMSRALNALTDQGASMTVLRTSQGERMATLVSGQHEAAVLPGHLHPTDPDHIYVLWGMSGETPVAVSTFSLRSGTPRTPQMLSWSAAAAKHKSYAVSLERGHSAPAAPTNVVAGGAKPS